MTMTPGRYVEYATIKLPDTTSTHSPVKDVKDSSGGV
jgi:hypothetical protein